MGRPPMHQGSRREPVTLHDPGGIVAIRRVTGEMQSGCGSGDPLPGMKTEFKMTEADRDQLCVGLPSWTCLGRTRLSPIRTELVHSGRLVPAQGHPLDDAVLITEITDDGVLRRSVVPEADVTLSSSDTAQ